MVPEQQDPRTTADPPAQVALDERIQVAIEHFLGIRGFDIGAQILDTALVEHIRANLMAPADIGLGVFHFLVLGIALA